MFFDGLVGIMRTAGIKTAIIAQKGRNKRPVGLN